MPNQLLDYIKQQLKEGVSKEEISKNLLVHGWKKEVIEGAFKASKSKISSVAPTFLNNEIENNNSLLLTTSNENHQKILEIPKKSELQRQANIILKTREKVFLPIMFSLPLVLGVIFLIFVFFYKIYEDIDHGYFHKDVLSITYLSLFILPGFIFATFSIMAFVEALVDNKIGVLESFRRSFKKPFSAFFAITLIIVLYLFGAAYGVLLSQIIFVAFIIFIPFIFRIEGGNGISALIKNIKYTSVLKGRIFSIGLNTFFTFLLYWIMAFLFLLSNSFSGDEWKNLHNLFFNYEDFDVVNIGIITALLLVTSLIFYAWTRFVVYLFVLYIYTKKVYDQKELLK